MDFTTFEGVLNYTRSQNLPPMYAVALYSQAVHETNNFTSNIYQNANNAFGMRIAGVRPQNRVGVFETANGNFAMYASPKDSFEDRIDLDEWNKNQAPNNQLSLKQYMNQVLDDGYVPMAQRPSYLSAWTALAKQVIKNNASSLGQIDDADDWNLSDAESMSTPMSIMGIPFKLVTLLLGLGLGFFGIKFLKKKFF